MTCVLGASPATALAADSEAENKTAPSKANAPSSSTNATPAPNATPARKATQAVKSTPSAKGAATSKRAASAATPNGASPPNGAKEPAAPGPAKPPTGKSDGAAAAKDPSSDGPKASAEETARIAAEAYIYGYPLVLTELRRRYTLGLALERGMSVPHNRFAHAVNLPRPEDKSVSSANVDMLYSVAWIDLKDGPLVLHVPDLGRRYVLIPLGDAWTNAFATLGRRATGSKAFDVLLTPPGWQGEVPAGLREIKCPSCVMHIMAQYQVDNPKESYQVNNLQRQTKLMPLADYKNPAPSQPQEPSLPAYDVSTPPMRHVEIMDPPTFFGLMAELMVNNPPAAADEPMVKNLAKIGVVPGKPFEWHDLDATTRRALERGIKTGLKRIKTIPADSTDLLENNWLVRRKGFGIFGTNYAARARAAFTGISVLLPEDSLFPTARMDAAGKPLSGAHRYKMHFDKDKLPPVDAFWSITMYDIDFHLVPNPLKRYTVGSRSKLIPNEDGSVDVYIQANSPGKEQEANWLPAAKRDFTLVMRCYGPKKELLDGHWRVPAIQRVD